MAGRGRGRGRGLLASKALAPGSAGDAEAKLSGVESPVSQSKKDTRSEEAFVDLEIQLGRLSSESDVTEDELQNVESLTNAAAASAEDMQKIARMIYTKCQSDRDFAKAAAMLCDRLSNIEKEGVKFRNCVLGIVQADYKGRDELRKKSRKHFIGFMAFLCQVFGTMRLINGEVMQPLVGPIFDCLEMVLEEEDIDGDECDCLSTQLQSVGRELQDNGEERMQQLIFIVRQKIIDEKTQPRVRCVLLEVLECYLRRWQTAPNEVTRFYLDTLMDILAGLVV
ncbi:hypothetical protein BaRGS_00033008 [Batillaria attramentaria]|uniref:MIF4G domain-containing protein n=1 Tax=Batillaria attramentaria TaxID=370345 RepID=A0ABD0JLR8_9CAEN